MNSKKKKIALVGGVLAIAAIGYVATNEKRKLKKQYPSAEDVLSSLNNYSVSKESSLARDIVNHINWSKEPSNASRQPVRAEYFKSISYNPSTALQHAKILGII